ncbi:hypothetical protein N9L83_02120 [Flavobacteriales bacterium]|nr:hypothetical protein [Flavobacteriales bacterium]
MNSLLRNILAGVAGAIVSMPANMLLLGPLGRLTGAPVAPLYDPLRPEASEAVWRAYFDSLDAVHMVGPLLAHWNGAFCGAFVAGLMAAHRGMLIPLIVAGFVMLGGIANAFVLPGQPPAFLVLDILGYLPVGWLGWKLSLGLRPKA